MRRVSAVPEVILKIYRSAYRRKLTPDEQAYLRMRIKDTAASRVRNGYRRIHVLLKREGWEINHKRGLPVL